MSITNCLCNIHYRSKSLHSLATALAPSIFRVGGTAADFLIFNSTATDSDADAGGNTNRSDDEVLDYSVKVKNFTINGIELLNFKRNLHVNSFFPIPLRRDCNSNLILRNRIYLVKIDEKSAFSCFFVLYACKFYLCLILFLQQIKTLPDTFFLFLLSVLSCLLLTIQA